MSGYLNAYSDWAMGLIPDKGKGFFLLHEIQSGSEAHPASYQIGT
jgi:hypothetical protein